MIPRSGLLAVCVAMAAVEWLAIASDYKDSVFLGTYYLERGNEPSKLILRADQTFEQDVTRGGIRQSRRGTWRRVSEGENVFSRELLPLSGQESGADRTSYGRLEKSFGIVPNIALDWDYVLWYVRKDPSQGAVAGTYTGEGEGVPAVLIMRSDHTFEQTVTHAGTTKHARGTWRLRGNGDILFSRDFLKLSGEPLTQRETASAWNSKGSNLQIEVAVDPSASQPMFRKTFLFD